jgi:hypothetical protein
MFRVREGAKKLQVPTSKLQRSLNLQAPKPHPPSFERSHFFTLNIVADVSRPALNPGPIKSRGQAFATLDLHKTLCALRGIWYLVIGISLELGGWNLELCYFSPK